MIRRPPRSTPKPSSAASDVYKRQHTHTHTHTRMDTHRHTHRRTYTHTHTHTHWSEHAHYTHTGRGSVLLQHRERLHHARSVRASVGVPPEGSRDLRQSFRPRPIPDVAASYNNIGLVYDSQDKYEEALEMQTKSLEIRTRIYGGDNHPDVAASKENIGLVFTAMGKKSEAKQMFTEAARIRRKVLGADHPLTKKSERLAAQ